MAKSITLSATMQKWPPKLASIIVHFSGDAEVLLGEGAHFLWPPERNSLGSWRLLLWWSASEMSLARGEAWRRRTEIRRDLNSQKLRQQPI